MDKVDFKKEYKHLYQASESNVKIIDVPAMKYLMINGQGSPNNSQEFQDGLEALYAAAYGIKMLLKKSDIPDGYFDYVIPPLEGLWWVEDIEKFEKARKKNWRWTLMIMQPQFVPEKLVLDVVAALADANKKCGPVFSAIRLETLHEGLCAQILHVGPYVEEVQTIAKINDYIQGHQYIINGKHHEIYLGDPRRTQPDKLKTIIRYPVCLQNQ